ncbi:hypothetical protein J6590_101839 [Homalodisca vitripennis]|nr:hypothetical protein J6590_101839 [Homalodisca vitripennis]
MGRQAVGITAITPRNNFSCYRTITGYNRECCINDPGSLLTRCTKGQRDLDLFRDRSRSTLKDDVQDGTASRASTDASLGPADRQTDTDHATQAHNRTNSTSDDRAKVHQTRSLVFNSVMH